MTADVSRADVRSAAGPSFDPASADVLSEDSGGVVTLTLNRPAQFNAMSENVLQALQAELTALRDDESVRCVVLKAAGKAFCAGHDLREMRSQPDLGYYQQLFATCSEVMRSIRELPVPVIASVHGIATAAGCQLVAACDLAIASQSAKFAVSGINVGLFCSTPAVALSRNISAKRAMDMLLTGRFISADTAAEWGLINEAVSDAELDEAVSQKVAVILEKSPTAVRYGKQMFYRQLEMQTGDAYAFAGDVMARNMMEEDAVEGIDAFLEKRAPRWRELS